MSKPSSSRVARVLKGLARWSVIGILSLVVLELLCHVVQLSGDSMTVDYVADPWLPYRMKPGSGGTSAFGVLYEINAVGLRSPEVVMPKPPGVFRVLVLGDSVTLGYGLPSEAGYTRLLEKMVEGSRVEVINAGASGYHFDDFVAYLEHYGLALDPDMVLCAFTRSDVEPPIKLDVRGGVGYEPGENVGFVPPFVKKLLRHSRLYLAVGRARWALGYQRAEENEADRNAAIVQKWPVVQATLDKLVSLTKERHLPLMVAYLPVQIEVFRGAEYPLLIDRLAKLDAPDYHFMNVLPDFEAQKDKVLYLRLDPAHPNAPGHQIIARAIAADPFFSARIKTGSK
jgi:lysophospholipase L1-like esterase